MARSRRDPKRNRQSAEHEEAPPRPQSADANDSQFGDATESEAIRSLTPPRVENDWELPQFEPSGGAEGFSPIIQHHEGEYYPEEEPMDQYQQEPHAIVDSGNELAASQHLGNHADGGEAQFHHHEPNSYGENESQYSGYEEQDVETQPQDAQFHDHEEIIDDAVTEALQQELDQILDSDSHHREGDAIAVDGNPQEELDPIPEIEVADAVHIKMESDGEVGLPSTPLPSTSMDGARPSATKRVSFMDDVPPSPSPTPKARRKSSKPQPPPEQGTPRNLKSAKAFTTAPRKGDMFVGFTSQPDEDPYSDRLCHVNSSILSVASEAFDKILEEKGFYNGTMTKVECDGLIEPVLFLNGDPITFRQVLKILHHRNNYVRPVLSYEAMVELAMIAIEYEVRQPLQIWADIWATELDKKAKNAKVPTEYGINWITVCWVFGLPDLSRTAGDLLARAFVDQKRGSLYFSDAQSGEKQFLDKRTHEQIIDEIKKARNAYVERLRDEFVTSYERARQGIQECHFSTHQRECRAMQLGDISAQASRMGLLDDAFWAQSIETIVEELGACEPLCLPAIGKHEAHTECSWVEPLQAKADRILEAARNPAVTKQRRENMFNISLNWEKVAELELD